MKKILLIFLVFTGQSAFAATDLTVFECSMPSVIKEMSQPNIVKDLTSDYIKAVLTMNIVKIGNPVIDEDLLNSLKERYFDQVDISDLHGEINFQNIHSNDVICFKK